MTRTRLTGREAIEYARDHGLRLSKYADPTEEGRHGLTVEEAEEVAREDASLIFLTAPPRQESPQKKSVFQRLYEAKRNGTGAELSPLDVECLMDNDDIFHLGWREANQESKRPDDADVWHAYDFSGRTWDHCVPGSRRNVYEGTKCIGFVTYRQGEFWSAYSLMAGFGCHPFDSEEDAEQFVRDHNKPVPNYSR